MFAVGFLLAGAAFVIGLYVASRLLPPGKSRTTFVLGVLAILFAYPLLHLVRPSYIKFKELCLLQSHQTIVKTKPVDYILISGGFPSDCTEGPAYIRDLGYLGFDCRMRVGINSRNESVTELYRYTKRAGAIPDCGLECFDAVRIARPESEFGYGVPGQVRAGYLSGDERRVTVDYPLSTADQMIPFWQWLRFRDNILVDAAEGEMAFTTSYFYLPYGPITILGLASGTAPMKQCPQPPGVDARGVYVPKRSSSGRVPR